MSCPQCCGDKIDEIEEELQHEHELAAIGQHNHEKGGVKRSERYVYVMYVYVYVYVDV
jgi:hypothetical protein